MGHITPFPMGRIPRWDNGVHKQGELQGLEPLQYPVGLVQRRDALKTFILSLPLPYEIMVDWALKINPLSTIQKDPACTLLTEG